MHRGTDNKFFQPGCKIWKLLFKHEPNEKFSSKDSDFSSHIALRIPQPHPPKGHNFKGVTCTGAPAPNFDIHCISPTGKIKSWIETCIKLRNSLIIWY
jgi:hypothetical protein